MSVLNVLIPGFCGGRTSYEPLRAELEAVTGDPTIYAESCRRGMRRLPPDAIQAPLALRRQAVHVMQQAKAGWEQHHGNITSGKFRVRYIGHSMGAGLAMLACCYNPEVVEAATALAPACMRKEGLVVLAKRTLAKAKADPATFEQYAEPTVRTAVGNDRQAGIREYVGGGFWRTVAEGLALSRTELYRAAISALARYNTPLHVAYAEQDELFPCTPVRPYITGGTTFVLHGVTHDVQLQPKRVVDELARHGAL